MSAQTRPISTEMVKDGLMKIRMMIEIMMLMAMVMSSVFGGFKGTLLHKYEKHTSSVEWALASFGLHNQIRWVRLYCPCI